MLVKISLKLSGSLYSSLLCVVPSHLKTIIGKRERANLVVQMGQFSSLYIHNGRWTSPYRNVLRDSKYSHKYENS